MPPAFSKPGDDFDEYLMRYGLKLLEESEQINGSSYYPHLFDGEDPDDLSHFANRSPPVPFLRVSRVEEGLNVIPTRLTSRP